MAGKKSGKRFFLVYFFLSSYGCVKTKLKLTTFLHCTYYSVCVEPWKDTNNAKFMDTSALYVILCQVHIGMLTIV